MAARAVKAGNSATVDRFLLSMQVEEGRAPLTLTGYRYGLAPFIRWLGDRPPEEATADDVRSYLAAVWAEFENPHTRFSRVKAVKKLCSWMRRAGLAREDAAAGVRTPRCPEQVDLVSDVRTVDALRRSCGMSLEGLRDRAMLEVAFGCGLRSVEIRRMALADVDWRERVMTVRGKARPGLPAPVRLVPFGVSVTRTLKRWVEARKGLGGDALFCDARGLPITRRAFVAVMQRMARRAGVEATWHGMRHMFVTEALRGGYHEEELRRVCGHKDRRMLARYAHLVTADLRRVHDAFNPADRLLRGD